MTFISHKPKLVNYLIRKTLISNSLVQKICMFLKKERDRQTDRQTDRLTDRQTAHCRDSSALGPKRRKPFIFGNQFSSKNDTNFRFCVFLHFYARKHDIMIVLEMD